MTTNKKITELAELSEADLSDDDVLAIVDVSADTTNKVRKSTLASALAGVASLSATSPVTVSAGTGAVNVAVTTIPITSGGTGATTAADARTNLGVPASTTVVTGPASATDSALALFDGTTGKIIKDSTYTITAAGAALIDDASASAQRTTLGAAASGANTDITSLGGLTTDIAVADGGTGAGTASAARTNLGAAASGSNSDITALTGLTTDIAVADGGTGAGTASAARTNLGAAASGSNSDITALTGLTTDLSVAQGGTGAGTFTANGVLHGNGTSAIGVTATGSSGEVLTSNGSGSAPTFQAAPGINVYCGGNVFEGSTTISRATWTNVAMTETADSGTVYDGTTFTVPSGEGGVYQLLGYVTATYTSIGNDGEAEYIRFLKGGSTALATNGQLRLTLTERYGAISTDYIGSLSAGDTIVVQAMFNDGDGSGDAAILYAGFSAIKVA